MALADISSSHRNEAGIATAIAVLQQRFGEALKTSQALREQHAHTTTYITPQLPDAVLFAKNEADVARGRAHLRRAQGTGDRVRHGNFAGG